MIAARIAVVMKQLRIHVCIHLMYVCCFNLPRRKANKRAKQKQRKWWGLEIIYRHFRSLVVLFFYKWNTQESNVYTVAHPFWAFFLRPENQHMAVHRRMKWRCKNDRKIWKKTARAPSLNLLHRVALFYFYVIHINNLTSRRGGGEVDRQKIK
jgi:hypothetical protein